MSSTLLSLRKLIQEETDVDVATVDAEKPLTEYGLDSLAMVELIWTIEDRFKITFPDSANDADTLSKISGLIDELQREAAQ